MCATEWEGTWGGGGGGTCTCGALFYSSMPTQGQQAASWQGTSGKRPKRNWQPSRLPLAASGHSKYTVHTQQEGRGRHAGSEPVQAHTDTLKPTMPVQQPSLQAAGTRNPQECPLCCCCCCSPLLVLPLALPLELPLAGGGGVSPAAAAAAADADAVAAFSGAQLGSKWLLSPTQH